MVYRGRAYRLSRPEACARLGSAKQQPKKPYQGQFNQHTSPIAALQLNPCGPSSPPAPPAQLHRERAAEEPRERAVRLLRPPLLRPRHVQQQRVVELGERGDPAHQEPAPAEPPAEGPQPSGAVGSSCARRSGARPPPSRVPRYHLGAPAPAAASLARDEHAGATPVPRAKVMNSRRSAVLGWNNGIRTGIVINCKFTPAATASSMQLQVPSAFSHAV